MAQLPPDGKWLMQQINGKVTIFNRETEQELISFNPEDSHDIATAQGQISRMTELTSEQKTFAHFWSGYFYAFANVG